VGKARVGVEWQGKRSGKGKVARGQERCGKCKYSLSNARAGTSWEKLREIQEQHHLVQHAFEDSKNKFGMTHYTGRSWRGWHHHMALYCLALLEALREHT